MSFDNFDPTPLEDPTTTLPLPELLAFAHALADLARPIARQYFRQPLSIEHKADASPVTVADRAIEAALRAAIHDRYPDHGVLGEEEGAENMHQRYTWVLDPIDGTKAFVTGMPTFGTLIALLLEGKPLIGVIDMPALDERWVGSPDGTTHNGQPCRTRTGVALADAALYATAPEMFGESARPGFTAVEDAVWLRRFGADCYAYGLLASGFVDLVIEASLAPYDYLALVPVVQGAGGVLTDWRGMPLHLESSGRVCGAATAALHREVLVLLGENR